MNTQRTDISMTFTSIQIVSVTFNQVTVDSNLNNLLSKLKVCFSELERQIKLNMPVSDVKGKAIEINSLVEVLMNSVREVDRSRRNEFSKNLVESCALIIERYQQAESIDGFGGELKQELISECSNFFDKTFSRYINDQFWCELKYYEWLQKEKLLYSPLMSAGLNSSKQYFSDEELEHFFCEKRSVILKRMLQESRDYSGLLQVSNPLDDLNNNIGFEAYKLIPNAT